MRIDWLANHPHFVPTLAEWHTREWGDVPPVATVADRVRKFNGHLNRDRLPLTLVAVEGSELLGSASLVEEDLPGREDLEPWLASVYVAPEHRRRGVGTELVRSIVDHAHRLGVQRLYLFTWTQERLYASLGWRVLERARLAEREIVIMEIEPPRTARTGRDAFSA